jgi:hypothetical protein
METNPIYDRNGKVKHIRNVLNNDLSTRIIFEQGEIVLDVSDGNLNAYSVSYLDGIRKYIKPKQIISGCAPQFALAKARNDIFQRIYRLETEALAEGVNKFLDIYFGRVKKKKSPVVRFKATIGGENFEVPAEDYQKASGF